MFASSRGVTVLYKNAFLLNRGALSVNGKFPSLSNDHQKRHKSTALEYIDALVESGPVKVVEKAFIDIHECTGLPWWASIVLTSFAIRTAISMPLAIMSAHNTAKIASLEPQAKQIAKSVKEEVAIIHRAEKLTVFKANLIHRQKVNERMHKLCVENNCHPLKSSISGLLELPVFFILTFALNDLSKDSYYNYELSTGGPLWLSDLSVADPYFIIGPTVGILNLMMIEIIRLQAPPATTFGAKLRLNSTRLLSVLFIFVACKTPAVLSFYWLSNTVLAAGQSALMKSPRFRSLLRIPKTSKDSDHPYRLIYTKIQEELKKLPSIFPPKEAMKK